MKKIELAALALSALVPFHAFADQTIVRTSAPGTGSTGSQAISGDGKYHAFSSTSTNLIAPDGNGSAADIFVRTLETSALERVSRSSANVQGNGNSTNPSVSSDGRFVAFESLASNLVSLDTNSVSDIFVFDRVLGTCKRVSVAASGAQSTESSWNPSISGDGSTIAFASEDGNLFEPTIGASSYIYVVKRETAGTLGSIFRIPLPYAPGRTIKECANPSLSQDGKFVAYEFFVADGPTTVSAFNYRDIYVYNLETHENIRITGNVATDGVNWNGRCSFNPSISGDGSLVAFESNAPLTSEKANVDPAENFFDVFVARIGESITYRLASKDTLGNLANSDDSDAYNSTAPALSHDGRFVSFESAAATFYQGATNFFPHIYRKELATGKLTLVAEGDDSFYSSAISSDGSVVAFLSDSTNVVAGDIDINSATDAFVAVFPGGPAVLAFNANSGATPIVDVTGNYTGKFPGSRKPYSADAAMDESGKVVTMGTVDGYTHPKKGDNVRMKGSVKTVNNTPTVSGSGNVKGGTMDGEPIGGSGKITVPLEESSTEEGSEFKSAVGSGTAEVEGERFKKPATLVSVPAEPSAGNKDWSLSLNITEKVDGQSKEYLAGSAVLYLPNGERTQFKEKKLTFSPKTGLYSTVLVNGIKVNEALEPILVKGKPVVDRKSRIVISEMAVESMSDPKKPTAGQLKYKFLGQKGSGDLLDFF